MDLKNIKDEVFDSLYPIGLRKYSNTHWTPVEIARKAILYLGENGKSVLDIGSGAGKFCLIAAGNSQSKITGIEKRENLVQISKKLTSNFGLNNLTFIQDDFTNVDFSAFDNFYFFNSFEENINLKDQIGEPQSVDLIQYQKYIDLLYSRFEEAPFGTKVVTYCGECAEIPDHYTLKKSTNKGKLKFWQKIE